MNDASNQEVQEVSRSETPRAPHSVAEGKKILQDRLGLITEATEYNPSWVPGNYWRPILLIIDADTARIPWYGGGGSEFAEKESLEASLLEMLRANGFDLDHPVAATRTNWLRIIDRVEPSYVWGDEGRLVPNPSSGITSREQARVQAETQTFMGPEIPFAHRDGTGKKILNLTRTDYGGDVNQRIWRIYSRFPAEASKPLSPSPPALGRGWTIA